MTAQDRKEPAIFLDRDGVICENRPDHVKSWSEFVFIPGSVEALASLTRAKRRVFVVTNQSAIGRAMMTRRTLDDIHERMLDVVEGSGARIEAILVCPHHPDDKCECRKPKPGLLRAAAAERGVDLEASFLVGDTGTDLRAGAAAGCRTILVRTGRGAETIRDRSWGRRAPDFVADDLVDAAIWILAQEAIGRRARGRAEVTRK
ncbi:MAG: D-glycero-beta-D-manno-heptose 1,7-bisphosphate 7-phosphatase [Actinomycetota bacterium]